MTEIPDRPKDRHVRPARVTPAPRGRAGYRVEETCWGYRIVPGTGPRPGLVVQQVLAMVAGAACVAAAVVLLSAGFGAGLMLRLPPIAVALAAGGLLMWYASRGSVVQIEIDTRQAEVRAVVTNRTGRATVMGRHGFDSIGSVFILRPAAGQPTLTLRYRRTARQLHVATGPEDDLVRLRDRLGRDLILNRSDA